MFWIFRLNFAISKPNFDEFLSEFRQNFQKISKFVENLIQFQKKCTIFPGNLHQILENCEIIHYFLIIIHSPP